jgi:hypothetical protein
MTKLNLSDYGVKKMNNLQMKEIGGGDMYIWKLLGFLWEGQVIASENVGAYQYGAVAFK